MELRRVVARGSRQGRHAGHVCRILELIARSGMEMATTYYDVGLYRTRVGNIVVFFVVDNGPWQGPVRVVPLIVAEVGKDGTEATIRERAQRRNK